VGEDWEKELNHRLDAAQLILLLVSVDFFASDNCHWVMMRAIAQHEAGKAHIIPILVRPVSWKNTPLGNLKAPDGRPIRRCNNLEDALADVVRVITAAFCKP
jgi:hypothetical protein